MVNFFDCSRIDYVRMPFAVPNNDQLADGGYAEELRVLNSERLSPREPQCKRHEGGCLMVLANIAERRAAIVTNCTEARNLARSI